MSNRLQHRTSVQAAMITGILYGRPDAEVSSVVLLASAMDLSGGRACK